MDTLKQTVQTVVAGYAGRALNGYSYLTQSADGTLLTVVTIARQGKQHQTGVGIIVRLEGEYIIIERDQTDKLVVDALIQAGVPREQIILAYAGEPVPELIEGG